MILAIILVFQTILVSISSVSQVLAETSEENLLKNGSYEEVENGLPTNWSTYTFNGNPSYEVDETTVKDGQYSIKISATESSRGTLYQTILFNEEQKGKSYTLKQWIKTENLTGTGAFVRLFLVNKDGARVSDLFSTKAIKGTTDWTLVETTVNVPNNEDVAGIKIENFYETGTGTAWFDAASFTELKISTDGNMVVNGGFEDFTNGLPDRWGTWIPIGSPTIEIDQSVFHSGQASLKISGSEPSRAALLQTAPITEAHKGNIYRFQGWIKTEDITGGALYRIQFINKTGGRVGPLIEMDIFRDTNDWTLVERFIEIPEDEAIVGVKFEGFFETGTGSAWFDDISFTRWIPVESIRFEQEEYELNVGETITLNVFFTPENPTDTELEWTSSNPNVAVVENGKVTAMSDGISIITAKSISSKAAASTIIKVGEQGGIIVSDYEVETDQDKSVSGTIEAESTEGLPLVYSKAVDPVYGIVDVLSDGTWTYYPDETFTGTDSFLVLVEDENGSAAISKVKVTVHPVNRPPVSEVMIQPTDKNQPVSGTIKASDPDGDTLTFEIFTHPDHGHLTMDDNGSWIYTPNTNYTGKDMFEVLISDSNGGEITSKVYLYTAPTAEEIIQELKEKNPRNKHPRIMATASDFERIRDLLKHDENIQEWFAKIQSEADAILPLEPAEYKKPDGLRLDTTASRRIATLSFVYQVTEDPKYAERAWVELEHVSSSAYPDWSHQHFLDTATMTYGVSLGYDWLYDFLNEEQRQVIKDAIITKGLRPAIPMYIDKTYWWVYNRDNWNFVCNAGMVMGALAIADEDEEIAGIILREAFKSIQYGLPQYAPDGSAIEGPGYWEYGTIYLAYFLSSLTTTFGHDFDMSDRDGIAETPEYPIYIAGPQGSFNYSDNEPDLVPGRLLLWFANRYNKPEYTWYHKFVYEKTGNITMHDILWYRPDTYGASEPAYLDRYFERPKAVTMRSSWADPNALFVGFKGGVNGAPHGDLDSGSFVFDANGVRWAIDLGRDDYNLPGYWNMDEDGGRWTYYRKRTEGHNTLVIQPSEKPGQKVDAISEITVKEFNRPEGAIAISDLTEAYKEHAVSVQRGVALIDHRRQFLVQDEVITKTPSELYWFMHTRANIEIVEDGKAAILTQDGKSLYVKILAPIDGSFQVMDAKPLDVSPNPSGQIPNLGVQKLAIHLDNVRNTTISVWMVPLILGEDVPENKPEVKPLAVWEIPEGELSTLSEITLDGQPLSGFNPNYFVYDVELPSDLDHIPVVAAKSQNSNDEVTIQQATDIPGYAKIVVTDPLGERDTGVYYIHFVHPKEFGIPNDRPAYEIVAVTASDHDGNVPENTIDDNLETRWSAYGEQWIQFDLGEIKQVSSMSIAWYSGDKRYSAFDIQTSKDGESWENVFKGFSSGITTDHEVYEFTKLVDARFVRVNGHGNSANQWNSISEVKIYGPKYELNKVVISADKQVIREEIEIPFEIKGYSSSGEVMDFSLATIQYHSSDPNVARVEDGVIVAGQSGIAIIKAEVTYRGKKVESNDLRLVVARLDRRPR